MVAEYLKRHEETLWAADFFSVRTVTTQGLRQMYMLVFICVSTREVIISEGTPNPNSAWVCGQTDRFLDQTTNREKRAPCLVALRSNSFVMVFSL